VVKGITSTPEAAMPTKRRLKPSSEPWWPISSRTLTRCKMPLAGYRPLPRSRLS